MRDFRFSSPVLLLITVAATIGFASFGFGSAIIGETRHDHSKSKPAAPIDKWVLREACREAASRNSSLTESVTR